MGRPVDEGVYEALLDELARLVPEAALGADLMVGFPGETEADFEELRGFLDRSPLTYAHVFPYSPRPGTPAAGRPQLPAAVVTERARALRRARRRSRTSGSGSGSWGGSSRPWSSAGRRRGAEVLTGNAIPVHVPECAAPRREQVRVAIRRVLPGRTEGEIVA